MLSTCMYKYIFINELKDNVRFSKIFCEVINEITNVGVIKYRTRSKMSQGNYSEKTHAILIHNITLDTQ